MAVPSRSAWRPGCSQRWAGCPPSRRSCRLPEQPPRPQQPSAMTGPGHPAARVRTPHPPRSRSPSGPCRQSIPGPLHQPRGADGALPPNGRQMVSLLTCRRARTCRLTAIPVSSGRTPNGDLPVEPRVGAAESRSAHPGRSIRAAWRGSRAPRRFPRRARCATKGRPSNVRPKGAGPHPRTRRRDRAPESPGCGRG
jgi:hypothetical protein